MRAGKKAKVGIVGAGPGGLVAARLLALQGRDVTVFERESAFSQRKQGGSLDIHADAGQLALSRAELTEEFQKIARYTDQEMRLYDMHGVLRYADMQVAGKDRPEVDRGHLRKMLLASLPEGMVRWDAKVTGVEPLSDGGCEVVFGEDGRQRFDLVVGADGTWSKVRPMLTDVLPRYTGVLAIEFGVDDIDRRYPDTAAMAGRGLTFALGDSKAIITHRDADAHLGGYVGLRVAADWFQQAGWKALPEAEARERLCVELAGWSEDLLLWVRRSQGPLMPWPIYELPAGHTWEHREGLTLLGDAAHVMSPFGGDGANLAMVDGAKLGEALLQDDWRAAVTAFEHAMCERATEPARSASGTLQDVFSAEGLEHSLRWPHVAEVRGA